MTPLFKTALSERGKEPEALVDAPVSKMAEGSRSESADKPRLHRLAEDQGAWVSNEPHASSESFGQSFLGRMGAQVNCGLRSLLGRWLPTRKDGGAARPERQGTATGESPAGSLLALVGGRPYSHPLGGFEKPARGAE